MRRVFVTGMGVVSSLGFGRREFNDALLAGRSAAAPVTNFDTSDIDRKIACEVKDFRARDFLPAAEVRRMGRCSAMAVAAARMAIEDAGLTPTQLSGDRTSVVLGTTMGEGNLLGELEAAWIQRGVDAVHPAKLPKYGTTLLPIHVARAVGAHGMVQTLPAACAAGNYAIGFASDQIRDGRADVVITGASEIMQRLQYAGFVRLGAVAPEKCQPFDKNRRGLLLGEGAGIFVLESEEHAVRRNATVLAEVGGYGLACDAHHITRPHPTGAGSAAAMREAIRTSGITSDSVDFINAHGTATDANDEIESRVIRDIFGAKRIPVTSIKSMLGHCMGSASALEGVSCVETIVSGIYPPTINLVEQDPNCDVDVIAGKPTKGPHDVVLNNALAFGGYDAVLLLAKPGVLPPPSERPL